MIAVPMKFDDFEVAKMFDSDKFLPDVHRKILEEKLLLMILVHYHGIPSVESLSNIGVELREFSCVKPPKPTWGDYLLEISYRLLFQRGWWRQTFHYVADKSLGGMSGKLYTRTRDFHEERH